MPTELRYQSDYAVVPRVVIDRYLFLPWGDVRAAAERGDDGLSMIFQRPRMWQGPQMGDPLPPNVAFLTEGQHECRGKTMLYQQNW